MRVQIHKTATGRTYGLQRRSLYCEPASERFPSSPCFCLSLKAERCARHRIIPSLGPAEFPSPPGRFFCILAIKPARWAIGQNVHPRPRQCRSLHSTDVPPIAQIRGCRTKKARLLLLLIDGTPPLHEIHPRLLPNHTRIRPIGFALNRQTRPNPNHLEARLLDLARTTLPNRNIALQPAAIAPGRKHAAPPLSLSCLKQSR